MSDPAVKVDFSEEEARKKRKHPAQAAETSLPEFAVTCLDAVVSPASEPSSLLQRTLEGVLESETRYRRLINRMSGVVFEMLPDGTLSYVNDAIRITGYQKEEVLGQNWWSLFFPGGSRSEIQDLRSRLATEDVLGSRIELTAKDGAPLLLEINTANHYDVQGRLERIIGFGFDVTLQNRAQEAARRLNERLLSRQRRLTHLFMMNLEDERRAISLQIHDGFTQYIMASFAFLEAYTASLSDPGESDRSSDLKLGMKYLRGAVSEARRLVNGLHTLVLDEMGLVEASHQLLHEEQERAGWLDVELIQHTSIPRFTALLETTAYRVVQEAVTNIRKHAEATRVQLAFALEAQPDSKDFRLAVEVRDWGKGFTPNDQQEGKDHIGLQIMQERVNLVNGEIEIVSAPGEGTHIYAWFPIDLPDRPLTHT